VGPLSVIDDHSRYVLVLKAVASTHTEQVRSRWWRRFASMGAGGDADGPRHTVVEYAERERNDEAIGVADAAKASRCTGAG